MLYFCSYKKRLYLGALNKTLKMKNAIFRLSLFLLIVIGFFSCETEPLDDGLGGIQDPLQEAFFSVNIQGENYSTNNAVATIESGMLTIKAQDADGQFVLQSQGVVVGTYTNSQLNFTYTDSQTSDIYSSIHPISGLSNSEFTVSSINFQSQTITGVFHFTGYKISETTVTEKVFSQGVFMNISYGGGSIVDPDPEEPGESEGDYLPMAVGNTWNYAMSNEEENNQMKITSSETIGGTLYYKISELPISTGIDTPAEEFPGLDIRAHVRKDGANYYQRFYAFIPEMMGGLIPQTEIESFEIIFLKDNLEVGEAWTQTLTIVTNMVIFGVPQTVSADAVFHSVIEEKGGSLVVNGVSYDDVIKVRTIATTVTDEGTEVATAENWYAKDIGLIRSYSNDEEEGESDMTLLDYILN